jgi:hypothetical protein
MASRQRVIVQKRYNSVLEPAGRPRLWRMQSHRRLKRFKTMAKWVRALAPLGRSAPFGNPVMLSAALLALWVSGTSLPALAERTDVVMRLEVADRSEATVDRAAREALEAALLRLSVIATCLSTLTSARRYRLLDPTSPRTSLREQTASPVLSPVSIRPCWRR